MQFSVTFESEAAMFNGAFRQAWTSLIRLNPPNLYFAIDFLEYKHAMIFYFISSGLRSQK